MATVTAIGTALGGLLGGGSGALPDLPAPPGTPASDGSSSSASPGPETPAPSPPPPPGPLSPDELSSLRDSLRARRFAACDPPSSSTATDTPRLATWAVLRVGDREWYGRNASVDRSTADFFRDIYGYSRDVLGDQVPGCAATTIRHAEGSVLSQLLADDVVVGPGSSGIMVVDEELCRFCNRSGGVQALMGIIGLEELFVYTPSSDVPLRFIAPSLEMSR